jgi:shikimate kinase
MKKNIVLTGFMGAGKTAVGKEVSERLGMPLVEMDEEIEKKAGMRISEIFERFGEGRFRELESEECEKIGEMENMVISAGGGVVMRRENVRALKRNGIVVFLHASAEVFFERVRNESHRPLLEVEEPMKKVRELLELRLPAYRKTADFVIDTSNLSVMEVADKVVRMHENMRLRDGKD